MGERAAEIDDTLDFINKELRSVQVTRDFRQDLPTTEIERARCAGLDFLAAVCDYLALTIHDQSRSSARNSSFIGS